MDINKTNTNTLANEQQQKQEQVSENQQQQQSSGEEIILTENGELQGDLGWDNLFKDDGEEEQATIDASKQKEEEETQQTDEEETQQQQQTQKEEEETKDEEEKETTSDTKKEEEETETKKQKENDSKNKYYTPEEIRALGLDKLDPNKLPPELIPFYKSMQADYTRKTQQAAEIRKAAEKIINNVMSQPLGELPQEVVKSITQQADLYVKSQLGDDVDEFDSDYIAMKSLAVQELANQYKKEMQVNQILQQTEAALRQSEPNFEAIEKIALSLIPKLPYEKALEIEQAKATGNPEPLIELFEEARKLYYSNELASKTQAHLNNNQNSNVAQQITQQQQTQTQRKPKEKPPAVETSGGQFDFEQQRKPKINPKDLRGKSTDEQARLLVELGII